MDKSTLFLSLYALISVVLDVHGVHLSEDELNLQRWNSYKIHFNKVYESAEHDQQRMKIYLSNVEKINKHNERFKRGEVTFEQGENHFADLTFEELEMQHLSRPRSMGKIKVHAINPHPLDDTDAQNEKNWVLEGAVTSVKHQGDCSCCWAFTAVALLEAHIYLKRGKLESLSAQNLVECSVKRSVGCCGGFVEDGLDYVKEHGIATEKSYPYTSQQKRCKSIPKKCESTNSSDALTRKIIDYEEVGNHSEALLKQAVGLVGPISAYFTALNEFSFYKSGVYANSTICGQSYSDTNHSVLIVGYGTTEDTNEDYWLVKNSWGVAWGEKGYGKIARGNNTCGIATGNFVPVF